MTAETRAPDEQWKVIDRWWTDEPSTRYYRSWYEPDLHNERIEVREGEGGEWKPWTPDLRSHEPPRNSGEGTAVNGPMPLAGGDDASTSP